MLEKLDFFKRDHHLSSGGTLKPDEHKQWQILFYLHLKSFTVFPPPGFLRASNMFQMQTAAELKIQVSMLRSSGDSLFVCLHGCPSRPQSAPSSPSQPHGSAPRLCPTALSHAGAVFFRLSFVASVDVELQSRPPESRACKLVCFQRGSGCHFGTTWSLVSSLECVTSQ